MKWITVSSYKQSENTDIKQPPFSVSPPIPMGRGGVSSVFAAFRMEKGRQGLTGVNHPLLKRHPLKSDTLSGDQTVRGLVTEQPTGR
ncbi:MAG: hypothetical protein R6X10_04265 [Desulfobacterales bacterium]